MMMMTREESKGKKLNGFEQLIEKTEGAGYYFYLERVSQHIQYLVILPNENGMNKQCRQCKHAQDGR